MEKNNFFNNDLQKLSLSEMQCINGGDDFMRKLGEAIGTIAGAFWNGIKENGKRVAEYGSMGVAHK